MNKKEFEKLIKRFVKSIVNNTQEEFYEKIMNEKRMSKISTAQLEELFFYRYFSKMRLDLFKELIESDKSENRQMAAFAISLMKDGWIGRSQAQFRLLTMPGYIDKLKELAEKMGKNE